MAGDRMAVGRSWRRDQRCGPVAPYPHPGSCGADVFCAPRSSIRFSMRADVDFAAPKKGVQEGHGGGARPGRARVLGPRGLLARPAHAHGG